jgi:hypothetical protein
VAGRLTGNTELSLLGQRVSPRHSGNIYYREEQPLLACASSALLSANLFQVSAAKARMWVYTLFQYEARPITSSVPNSACGIGVNRIAGPTQPTDDNISTDVQLKLATFPGGSGILVAVKDGVVYPLRQSSDEETKNAGGEARKTSARRKGCRE